MITPSYYQKNKKQTAVVLTIISLLAAAVPVAPAGRAVAAQTSDTLAGALSAMEANTTSLSQQAADIDRQSAQVAAEVADLQNQYNALVPQLAQKQATLKQAIRQSYVTGPPSTLEVVATNQTFSSVISQQSYSDQVGAKTKKMAEDVAKTKQEVSDKLTSSQQKQDGLASLRTQLDDKITTAQQQVQAEQTLVQITQGKEEEYQKIAAAAKAQNAGAAIDNVASPAPSSHPSPVITGMPSSSPEPFRSGGGGGASYSGGNNPYPYGQCTWYVFSQTGRGQQGNAGSWGGGSSGGVGSLLVMPAGVGGAGWAGHVGVIVGMSGSGITIRDMNWSGGPGVVSTHTVPRDSRYRYL